LLGDDVIGRLVVWVLGDRNKAGGGKTVENGREGEKGGEREGERETNETSWCVSSDVAAVEDAK